MLRLKTVSGLEKIQARYELGCNEINELSALVGESVSFQIAYSSYVVGPYKFEVVTDSETEAEVYFVENVPVGMATLPNALNDPDYIIHESGLLPNLLRPADRDWVRVNDLWHSMWIKLKAAAGDHKVTVKFKSPKGEDAGECTLNLHVVNALLPEQTLKYTNWFHADCIATYYGYDMFSEEHWQKIESFLKLGHETGMNMILTPVFTPPLDTEIGGERPTTQLLKIEKTGDSYSFDFTLLERWIRLCKEIGFKYFEMPHLFTQWGAKATPKIVALENGEEKKIFGWDVSAESAEYDNFLSQLIPQLRALLQREDVFENTYFHISDEPNTENIEFYKKAKAVADKYLDGCKVIDALSHTEFYDEGYVKIPVPELVVIKDWLDKEPEERWCYYCCGDVEGVSNRLVAMPSARNRSIGTQLYKHKMDGFLHWGFNFYYSDFSRLVLDPYFETDAGGAFSSGDAFVVYPGKKGAIPTICLFTFADAIQDIRALKLLERYIGYDETVKLIEKCLGETISFYHCFSAEAIMNMRKTVNETIEKCLQEEKI